MRTRLPGQVEIQEGRLPSLGQDKEGVQPDGLASQQEETELIWGHRDNAAIPQG